MTELSRANLKRAILAKLDSLDAEHPLGHQPAYASRYKLRSNHDAPIEFMFEKDPETEPHLWVLADQVATLPDGAIPAVLYPKAALNALPAKNGGKQYGRHSALEKMTHLGKADLVRFTLCSLADLDLVLSTLMQAQRRVSST